MSSCCRCGTDRCQGERGAEGEGKMEAEGPEHLKLFLRLLREMMSCVRKSAAGWYYAAWWWVSEVIENGFRSSFPPCFIPTECWEMRCSDYRSSSWGWPVMLKKLFDRLIWWIDTPAQPDCMTFCEERRLEPVKLESGAVNLFLPNNSGQQKIQREFHSTLYERCHLIWGFLLDFLFCSVTDF